jgi:hypothetical protein
MALCPDCDTVIPCHCHLTTLTEIRYGVYLTPDPETHARQRADRAQQQPKETRP